MNLILLVLCVWYSHDSYAAQAPVFSGKEPSQPVAREQKKEAERKQAAWLSNVNKISEGLYTGKVADTFYLAMERVDSKNINQWLKYAHEQVEFEANLIYLPNKDGSAHFELVLKEYQSDEINQKDNELWIAYASTIPVTKKTQLSDGGAHIDMFVTVVTSSEALITSHMGISRTWQAASDLQKKPPRRIKHPDQSVHLHSFAAKVTKMRDPEKVYMLTAPAIAMRDILIKKMPPYSVFVGDSIYQQELEAAEKDPKSLLTKFDLKDQKGETAQEREERLNKKARYLYDYYKIGEKMRLLKTNPPRIVRVKDGRKQTFTIQKPDGVLLVTFDQSTTDYQWMFAGAYISEGLKLPYILVDLDKLAAVSALVPEQVSSKKK